MWQINFIFPSPSIWRFISRHKVVNLAPFFSCSHLVCVVTFRTVVIFGFLFSFVFMVWYGFYKYIYLYAIKQLFTMSIYTWMYTWTENLVCKFILTQYFSIFKNFSLNWVYRSAHSRDNRVNAFSSKIQTCALFNFLEYIRSNSFCLNKNQSIY